MLSIGSNQGDRLGYLRSAAAAFADWLVSASPVFRTAPWGPVEQDDFFNAILVVEDAAAAPIDWLRRAQACEQAADRLREQRWGPRTLDVDVVVVDDVVSDDPELTLPHPRLAERAFVLAPWWAVDPEAQVPGQGSVLSLLQKLPAGEVEGVRMLPGLALTP